MTHPWVLSCIYRCGVILGCVQKKLKPSAYSVRADVPVKKIMDPLCVWVNFSQEQYDSYRKSSHKHWLLV